MTGNPKGSAFSDLSSKLSTAPKKSLFERQKAEAEAKRAREKAETEAVYADFVKSFDDDGVSHGRESSGSTGVVGYGGGFSSVSSLAPSKRHFTGSGMNNVGLGAFGTQNNFGPKKRIYDGFRRERDAHRGGFSFDKSGVNDPAKAFQTSDDEEEKEVERNETERAAAKPTLRLASLPPGMSPAAVKALIAPTLTVDNVKIIPPSLGTGDRKNWSSIVTLAHETAAADIDSVVSSQQNKYLGWGHYLSISRHLSSAAINSVVNVGPGLTAVSSQPFGARQVQQSGVIPGKLSSGPHRGFAPPPSYGSSYAKNGPAYQVEVKIPSDLKEIKLIHKTIENLLAYGPEFEALLMNRIEVQRDQKWAWIWDPRSTGGVYYRWKLWCILTGIKSGDSKRSHVRPAPVSVFDNGPSWVSVENCLPFEYATSIDHFISDDDYDSSDENDSDHEDDRRLNEGSKQETGDEHLNPLQKAKLVHLLARLPTTNAKLRKGDVARVTSFAISHAGKGPDEVVDMVISNVAHPFAFTNANPDRQKNEAEGGRPDTDETSQKLDDSAARLVGLYAISDILSTSSTSGVRHAWRYRQLFESGLKWFKIFEQLGRLERDLKWGRLKIEKWRRSINNLLSLWEGWCVFPQESQDYFVKAFENPPLTEEEMAAEKERLETENGKEVFGNRGKSKWKAVHEADSASQSPLSGSEPTVVNKMDVDGEPMPKHESLESEYMDDIDGISMEDSDLEDINFTPIDENVENQVPEPKSYSIEKPQGVSPVQPEPHEKSGRSKVADMFADSDSE